jgi:hypothetical protein
MRNERTVTVGFGDSIHICGVARFDRIALVSLLWCDAPAIVDAIEKEKKIEKMK